VYVLPVALWSLSGAMNGRALLSRVYFQVYCYRVYC